MRSASLLAISFKPIKQYKMIGKTNHLNYLATRCMSNHSNILMPFRAIPGPKPLPLIGNVWRYLPVLGNYQIDKLFENALYNKKRYGSIVREQLTPNHTILHLFDPNDIKSFIKQDTQNPFRRSHRALRQYRLGKPTHYNDGGLFPENGPSWSRLRRLFQLRDISSKTTILDEISIDELRNLCPLDENVTTIDKFDRLVYRWAIRSSLALFLDYDIEERLTDDIVDQLIDNLHEELEAVDGTEIKTEKWIKEPGKCPFFKKLVKTECNIYEFVENRVNYLLDRDSFKERSFLHKWLVIDKIDKRDVITFVMDLMMAGLHTTTYTTIFLLYNMARSEPTIQESLRAQMSHYMSNEPMTAEIVERLTILKDCLNETLRLNPISIGTGRVTQNEMVIRNFKVPENVMVIAHVQTMCSDPLIFEQPESFKPSRWAMYRASPKDYSLSQLAFRPFGFGPRICVGLNLAKVQISILAARLFSQYDIKFLNTIKTKTTLVHNLDGHVAVEMKRLRR